MAIAMTVGATKIQILQQTCLGSSGEETPAEAAPAEQTCDT